MRRKTYLGLIAIVALLFVADLLFWHAAARRLESGFQAWVTDGRQHGWTITSSSTELGGWPMAATLTVTDLAIAGGEPVVPGGIFWDTKRLVLRVDLLSPWVLDLEPIGVQRLRVADGPELPFVADTMHATVALETAGSLDLRAQGLRAALPTEGDASENLSIATLRCRLATIHGAEGDPPSLSVAMTAETIGLPRHVRWPLGPTIASLNLEGVITGPMPPPGQPSALAAAWRDAGGSAEVQKLVLSWGPLTANGAATLALDEQLQPMGAGTAKLTGFEATLDALASNGVMTRSAAKAAKAVLSLLAGTPQEGETPEVEVPLTLQYRTLSMRQVPLARLPELDWPAP